MNKRNIIVICAVVVLIIIIWTAVRAMNNKNNSSENVNTEITTESVEPLTNEAASDKISGYLAEQDHIMHTMMGAMGSVESSGSADVNFLMGMIPHHESAVEMAESYLKYGAENESMKSLAENIIKTQNEEITQMNNMVKSINTENANTDNEKAYINEYMNMMQHGHSHNNANYENIDMAFAEGMMKHHQMAIDMAEIIIKYGEDEQVKRLAENIIETQKKEIEEMNNFLNS